MNSTLELIQQIRLKMLSKIGRQILEGINKHKLKKMFKTYFKFLLMFFDLKSKIPCEIPQGIPCKIPCSNPIPPEPKPINIFDINHFSTVNEFHIHNVEPFDSNILENFFHGEIIEYLNDNLPLSNILSNPFFSEEKYICIDSKSTVYVSIYSFNMDLTFGITIDEKKSSLNSCNCHSKTIFNSFEIGVYNNILMGFFVIFGDTTYFTNYELNKISDPNFYRHQFVEQINSDIYNNLQDTQHIKNYILSFTSSIEPLIISNVVNQNLNFKDLVVIISVVQNNLELNTSNLVNQ